MQLLDEYNKLEKQIHEYFGYEEDWVVIPMMDSTDYYWHLTGQGPGDEVKFAEQEENVFEGTDDDGYAEALYTQRFLPRWVYRGKDYTMISVDTMTDGNKFLRIFDNAKEVKEAPEDNDGNVF